MPPEVEIAQSAREEIEKPFSLAVQGLAASLNSTGRIHYSQRKIDDISGFSET